MVRNSRHQFSVSQGETFCFLARQQMFHPVKQNCPHFLLHSMSLISSSLSPPFLLRFLTFKKWEELGRYMGGTWEEHFRFTFVTSLLSNRYQSEVLSKTKRSSIEDLSNIYRRPIEHLSNTYRREYASTVLSTSIWFVGCTE